MSKLDISIVLGLHIADRCTEKERLATVNVCFQLLISQGDMISGDSSQTRLHMNQSLLLSAKIVRREDSSRILSLQARRTLQSCKERETKQDTRAQTIKEFVLWNKFRTGMDEECAHKFSLKRIFDRAQQIRTVDQKLDSEEKTNRLGVRMIF